MPQTFAHCSYCELLALWQNSYNLTSSNRTKLFNNSICHFVSFFWYLLSTSFGNFLDDNLPPACTPRPKVCNGHFS